MVGKREVTTRGAGRTGELRPMLLAAGPVPLRSAAWVYETKWDGMRVLAGREGLVSRHGTVCTSWFPELREALSRLPADSVFDGEVVRFRDNTPDFGALLRRIRSRSGREAWALGVTEPCRLILWDVLRLDGGAITGLPWHARREALEWSVQPSGLLELSPTEDDGERLWQAMEALGWEGIVAKRRDSRYRPGERSADWVKVKRTREDVLTVGGCVGAGRGVATLVVGNWTAEGLEYRGHVGTGLTAAERLHLGELTRLCGRETCPFITPPPRRGAWGREPAGPVRWVEPELRVRVRYHPGGGGRELRDAVLVGLEGIASGGPYPRTSPERAGANPAGQRVSSS